MKTHLMRMRATAKCPPRKPLTAILWSGLGSFLGIYLVAASGQWLGLGLGSTLFLIGSFGASAVLVYGAPRAELAQPRNLIGGHGVSAAVGVTAYLGLGSQPALAAALAVSLAIVAMHFTRTLHPPGGATALIAVIGDERIHALGYMYVLSPVLGGAAVMLLVALLVNNASANPDRHYPVYWF